MPEEKKKSLVEKYREHYSTKNNFNVTLKDLNNILPIWTLLTMMGSCYYGQFYITPAVHSSFEVPLIAEIVLYGIMYFLLGQVIVNWWFIRKVHSKYAVDEEAKIELVIPKPDMMDRSAEVPYKPVVIEPVEDENANNKETMVWMRYRGNGQIYAVKMKGDESKENIDPDKATMYPYWSWKPCLICQHNRPPRTHHCPVCNECMLKRDYHCFFIGLCISMNNQRFFIVLAFWSIFATTFSLIYGCLYVYVAIYDYGILEWYDIFLPQTFVDWLVGNTEFSNVIIFTLLYSIVFFWATSIRFAKDQFSLLRAGLTSFEMENKVKIQNTNSFWDELGSVFGKYWYANFLFPLHLQFPVEENGKDWPNIKQ